MSFSETQLERYSRHIILQEVGIEGQERIMSSRVLVIGAGGLGSPAALYLAAAGIGTIGIVDSDTVELSNLQRQIAHYSPDLGRDKVLSSAEKMQVINPDVRVQPHKMQLDADNIRDLIRKYDFIVEGTDNFPTKFLVNDACIMAGIPFSHGGILRFWGQTMTVVPGSSCCFRCCFRQPPPPDAVPSCSQAGVFGAVAGMLGTIQAAETLKYVTGAGQLLSDTLLTFNALDMNFRRVSLKAQENCPVCGVNPTITKLVDYEQAPCSL